VQDLELDPVGIVEEAGVVPGAVVVLLRLVLDLQALLASPAQALSTISREGASNAT
jgi:hypothetical protein